MIQVIIIGIAISIQGLGMHNTVANMRDTVWYPSRDGAIVHECLQAWAYQGNARVVDAS